MTNLLDTVSHWAYLSPVMTAQELRARRVAAGLSQADVASALGLHARTVERWELGKTFPGKAELIALEVIFGTPQAKASRIQQAARKANKTNK
jgi:transcriptional regulator with XRE-family HTH domain